MWILGARYFAGGIATQGTLKHAPQGSSKHAPTVVLTLKTMSVKLTTLICGPTTQSCSTQRIPHVRLSGMIV